MSSTVLAPLPYHRYVATRLETLEPVLWKACDEAGRPVAAEDAPPDDDPLAAHAVPIEVLAAVAAAADALRVTGNPQAELPASIVLAIGARGADDATLRARAGRAIARQILWTADEGRFGTADRLLRTVTLDVGTPMPYVETARRYALATDLHGDRAATVAAGDLAVAVSGIGGDPLTVHGRTKALEHWYRNGGAFASGEVLPGPGEGADGDPEAAARAVLSPGLDVDRLDVLDRERLEWVTRGLLEDLLADRKVRTDRAVAAARGFFPDLAPTEAEGVTPVPPDATPLTRRYLAYVALDVLTADPHTDAFTLVTQVAEEAGIGEEFAAVSAAEMALQ